MIDQVDIIKLERFIEGKASESEKQQVYALFAEKENDLDFQKIVRNDFFDNLNNSKDENYNLSFLLDRIHHTIHKNENIKKKTVIRKLYSWYSVAAAILLIPLLIAGVLWVSELKTNSYTNEASMISTLHAPQGARISFSLPDGTQGWLNSGSSLEYQIPFSKNRNLSLVGEAWFSVTHDAEHPFEIQAGTSRVKVLGTKFNLSAYPDENYVEVVLEEGAVNFSTTESNTGITMKPSERLIYKSDSINLTTTDPSKYSAWTEGKLVFRGDSMAEVARRLERWYNIEVVLVDKELEEYIIRGTFEDDSLEDVLKYLAMTSPIRYQISERKILDDGTYQKKKVMIYKTNQ
ncbi:FecR family protein [Maribellus sediminis]|uniref:FecR family protein n=1 Tax=Maribellus sediminis TaxID=2696285 RepID=UPI0014303001|nr:FecR domain-containing protein [Maribellus sediminis]